MNDQEESAARFAEDVTVVLPDEWWLVPLQDDDLRSAAIARLVDRQFRGVDNQPLLKEQARRKLAVAARQAAEGNGRFQAISLMQASGIPLSASLTAYWIALGLPEADSHVQDLNRRLADADADDESARYARADFEAGEALRRVRTRPLAESADPELVAHPDNQPDYQPDTQAEMLQVDYWVEMPRHAGMVQLTFSTALVGWREQMLTLFDAIAASTAWTY